MGGVVTGRWASSGGGALQLPQQVRRAVVADPGWKLVVADAAQLEPRVLAGLAHDERMAAAGRGGDMYAGIVASGAVATRDHAKVGMLGAMYGGTTGDSALVLPRLAKAFPDAIGLVERAAQAGERGEVVSTLLGRARRAPASRGRPPRRARTRSRTARTMSGAAGRARTRRPAPGRTPGRGAASPGTSSCRARPPSGRCAGSPRSGAGCGKLPLAVTPGAAPAPFADRAHLVFFLHDEVVVHAPAELAEAVADEVRAAAAEAGRLLFGEFPVDFPLTVAVVDHYAEAK